MTLRQHFSVSGICLGSRTSLLLPFLLPFLFVAVACDEEDGNPAPGEQVDSTRSGDLEAEWSIDEGIGPIHLYNMSMTMEQSTEMGEEPMVSNVASEGTIRMRKVDSSAEGITWIAVMDVGIEGETGGTAIPTMNQSQRLRYVVSPEGRILNVAMRSEDGMMDESVQQALQEVSERHNASQFFLKDEWKNRSPGETWEETIVDTIDFDSVAFMGTAVTGDLDLWFNIRTRYTYRGEIDTLGMTMIRIDSETLAMTIDGAVRAKEMEMMMRAEGTGTGTQYFDPKTDLYTVGIGNQQMTTTLKMPSMNMEVPMKQKMSLTSVRGDLVK